MRNSFVSVAFFIIACLAVQPAKSRPSLVFDAATGEVLHAQQAGLPWHPASLTKMMTAYIIFGEIKAGRLDPDKKLTVSKAAAKKPASKMGVPAGKTVTLKRALMALTIRSANDMAVVLAEAMAGTEKKFALVMNLTAKKLGMTKTFFVNAHGLHDPLQVTSARDMGLLTKAIITEFPKLEDFFAEKSLVWGKKKLRNRNRLLRNLKGADGMKTGYVCASGFNLVASATRGGRRLVSVVLGAPSSSYRFEASANLLNKGFEGRLAPPKTGLNLSDLKNSFFKKRATNLIPAICGKQKVAIRTKPSQLKGWGILFGVYKSRKTASRVLNNRLYNLRGALTGAQSAVLKSKKGTRHAAILAGLGKSEMRAACAWMAKAGAKCVPLNPKQVRRPKALLR